MLLYTLIEMIGYLVNIVVIAVIVQFVLSLLITFNVVNMHNAGVSALWTALNAILDPILKPIRRIMPDTGAIDFSPMVFLMLLNAVGYILQGAMM